MDGHWCWQNPLCYLSGMPFINNPALHFMTAFYLEPNCIFLTCGASAQTLKQEEMYIRCYRKKGSGTISGNSEYNNVLSDTIPWMATQKKKNHILYERPKRWLRYLDAGPRFSTMTQHLPCYIPWCFCPTFCVLTPPSVSALQSHSLPLYLLTDRNSLTYPFNIHKAI